jgi:hypothetical protein
MTMMMIVVVAVGVDVAGHSDDAVQLVEAEQSEVGVEDEMTVDGDHHI